MQEVFLRLFNISITAGWLILAVLVARLLLRKAPKWMTCLLWGMVAVRLLCPVSIESIFSLIPSAKTVSPEILTSDTPTITTGISIWNTLVNPVITNTFAPTVGASVNPLQIWALIAALIWLAGVAVLLIYALVSSIRLKNKVKASLWKEGNVWICDEINTPFIFGVVRPRIYLPSNMDEEQQKHVLAHERAHIRRCDHIWKPLGFLLLAVYWFHPLIWIAYLLLCRDIELACDERVIKEMELDEKKAYSETLLNFNDPKGMITACLLAFGEVGVKARIKSVLNYKKPAVWIILVATVVCITLAVCFLTDPKEPLPTVVASTEVSPTPMGQGDADANEVTIEEQKLPD